MTKYKRLRDIPQFTRWNGYQVSTSWGFLEETLDRYADMNGLGTFNMNPDFQREHVWTKEQQISYVEFAFRGGQSGKIIHWNHPNWQGSYKGEMVLVDGKQRLEAARLLLADELPLFGKTLSQYEDEFPSMDISFLFHVNTLPTRAAVLQWYLELNTGGVVHTDEEIEKVRKMLAAEKRKK